MCYAVGARCAVAWDREQMAKKAATFVRPGQVVNLGIGIPTLVATHLGDQTL